MEVLHLRRLLEKQQLYCMDFSAVQVQLIMILMILQLSFERFLFHFCKSKCSEKIVYFAAFLVKNRKELMSEKLFDESLFQFCNICKELEFYFKEC